MGKYRQGSVIDTIDALAKIILRDEYVFLDNKPKHPAWVGKMQLRAVQRIVKANRFKVAIDKKTNTNHGYA